MPVLLPPGHPPSVAAASSSLQTNDGSSAGGRGRPPSSCRRSLLPPVVLPPVTAASSLPKDERRILRGSSFPSSHTAHPPSLIFNFHPHCPFPLTHREVSKRTRRRARGRRQYGGGIKRGVGTGG